MLRLEAIGHNFGQGPVLEAIDLTLRPGEVLALTGPSGCGKSTLLNIAAGLLTPTAGRVVNGFARSAYVFQDPRLLPWRTAGANMAFGLKALGLPAADQRRRVAELARRLGLEGALDRFPNQLSGGMRQRVALGRALAVEPDLLLLDEPFSAVDPERRAELQELVLGLLAERNLAAMIVTHDLAEAERMAHEWVLLSPAPGRVMERRRRQS